MVFECPDELHRVTHRSNTKLVQAMSVTGVAVASLLISIVPAAAQDERADVIRQAQVEKQQAMPPSQPKPGEAFIKRLEDWGLFVGEPRGVYPWLGSVYPGGGFAGGVGFRKPFADDGAFHTFGGYSINGFSRAQVDLSLPTFARRRAQLIFSGRYVNAPDVRYFGVGNTSSSDDETRFGYTPTSGGARLEIEGSKHVSFGGGVDYIAVETSGGKTAPSIGDLFTAADTPGLDIADFTYINSTAHATFDWRNRPGYAGSGGMYRAQLNDFREQDLDVYSFQALEVEARQLIPILRANWIIALRGLATITDIEDTSSVPYFMLPSLGGGSTLRGYPDFRFRDRNRLLMQAELRWTPARFMDMAVFYDTGKVAARHQDLDFTELKDSYGIGMRIIGPDGYLFRVEVAHSREHNARLIVSAGGGIR